MWTRWTDERGRVGLPGSEDWITPSWEKTNNRELKEGAKNKNRESLTIAHLKTSPCGYAMSLIFPFHFTIELCQFGVSPLQRSPSPLPSTHHHLSLWYFFSSATPTEAPLHFSWTGPHFLFVIGFILPLSWTSLLLRSLFTLLPILDLDPFHIH